MDLVAALRDELARRQRRNRRYSLRAFARDLAVDHSALSQILRGRRPLSERMVRRLGPELGMSRDAIESSCVELVGRAILRAMRAPTFRPRSPWIAERIGRSVDRVNAALHWLLRERRLVMRTPELWQEVT